MGMEEVYRDYFEDVNPEYKQSSFNILNSPRYKDRDSASAKLYDALYKLFFYDYNKMKRNDLKCVQIVGHKFDKPLFYSFFVKESPTSDSDFILSSDYIGPSKYQAKYIARLSDNEIKKFIEISRTLGGHIIWPRGIKLTINKVKGGELKKGCGYGFYDRIDWTFLLLKHYYSSINYEDKLNRLEKYEKEIMKFFSFKKISKQDRECFKELFEAFDISIEWFKKFKSFNNFCDFFKVTGSFVDDLYNVIELTPYFPIKPDKKGYLKYIENNLNSITLRNSKILSEGVFSLI